LSSPNRTGPEPAHGTIAAAGGLGLDDDRFGQLGIHCGKVGPPGPGDVAEPAGREPPVLGVTGGLRSIEPDPVTASQ
jgi:hypothetical protein